MSGFHFRSAGASPAFVDGAGEGPALLVAALVFGLLVAALVFGLHNRASPVSHHCLFIARKGAWRLAFTTPYPVTADARGTSAWGARLCGIGQVLLGCRLSSQLPESSVAKFLLHALSEFVRLAQKTPGP